MNPEYRVLLGSFASIWLRRGHVRSNPWQQAGRQVLGLAGTGQQATSQAKGDITERPPYRETAKADENDKPLDPRPE
jgi:hypothetical protein